jgi:hypothetical protein
VCIAADPERKRGVYAGLLAIHELLTDAGYAALFRQPEPAIVPENAPVVAAAESHAPASAADAPTGGSLLQSLVPADEWPMSSADIPRSVSELAQISSEAAPAGRPVGLPIELGDDVNDAEIVCIIRPRNRADSPSEVVIVHQASPKLLSYLRGEMGTSVGSLSDRAILSDDHSRRSRESSVPTMDVTPSRPLGAAGEESLPASFVAGPRPTLHPTALTAPILPRRYIRTR